MLKVFETFAGIGAQTKALKNIGIKHKVVAISEWDLNALISYANVHCKKEMELVKIPGRDKILEELNNFTFSNDGKVPLKSLGRLSEKRLYDLYAANKVTNNLGSIMEVDVKKIPDLDLLTYSFPCQAISLQGKQEGLERGTKTSSSLLWEVERILIGLRDSGRLPKYLLMENVANLLSAKFMPFFNSWVDFLNALGYETKYGILKASNFDCPQNRSRAFAISVLGKNSFKFPGGTLTDLRLKDVILNSVEEKYYLDKLLPLLKGRKLKDSGICSGVLEGYTTFQSENIVYYLEGIAPTITANGAQSRVKVVDQNGRLRYLVPLEMWRLMGFEDCDYNAAFEGGTTETILKKQAGNSICVKVLEKVFANMFLNKNK